MTEVQEDRPAIVGAPPEGPWESPIDVSTIEPGPAKLGYKYEEIDGATKCIQKFVSDATWFRINAYVHSTEVEGDWGYYEAIPRDPDRKSGFQPYKTSRMCFPFTCGRESGFKDVAAEWPIVAEHAAMAACQAMTLRVLMSTSLVNIAVKDGEIPTWEHTQIVDAVESAKQLLKADGIPTEGLRLVMNPILAHKLPKTPDAEELKNTENPNRKYGQGRTLHGVQLVVENAVRLTASRDGEPQTREYVWDTELALLCYVAPEGTDPKHSTLRMLLNENAVVSCRANEDSRVVGRVVDDLTIVLNEKKYTTAFKWSCGK